MDIHLADQCRKLRSKLTFTTSNSVQELFIQSVSELGNVTKASKWTSLSLSSMY